MSLRLITLGAPRVFDGKSELIDLPSQRLRFALLVYLAVEGEASRESVLALFWPDRAASRARHALRQMLYELRQLLGETWLEVSRDRIVVRAEVDAAAFEEAAAAQQTAAALELYGGAFLDGFGLDNRSFEGWVDRRRAQLGRTHRRLRRDCIDDLLAAARADDALQVAHRWVALDPLEDEASHALIRCLALTGQRLEALQYFDSYERQLAAELQVEPLDETRALVEQIRRGEVLDDADLVRIEPPANVEPTTAVQPATSDRSAVSVRPAASEQSAASERSAASEQSAASERSAVSVRSAASELPAGLESAADQAPPRTERIWTTRVWRKRLLAAAGLVALLYAGTLGYRSEQPRIAPATPSARVIILPFVDRSEDSTLVSLADALTEALARNLAQSRPLDIVSPTGVAMLRERGVSADSLRRLLRADYLVSGSVSSGPGSVRVAVELLDGRTGSLLGSELIERDRAESRILVEDVTVRTTGFLRREVGNLVDVRRVRASTASEEAWRNVLEARQAGDRLGRLVRYRDYAALEQAMNQSDSLLTRAGELDRRWAEPLIMRGWLMEQRVFVAAFVSREDTASRRKLLEAGRSMADRAIERDPNEPRAYELRGAMLHQLGMLPGLPMDSALARFTLAEQELRRATHLDPYGASSWRRLAELLYSAGRYAAAKTAAERAYSIDRYVREASSIVNLLFSSSLELGEDAEAERWCMEGRKMFPGQPPFVHCLFALHAWGEHSPPDLELLRHELFSYQQAQPSVQPELLARFETLLATAHARAGEQDSARAILRRTAAASDPGVLWLRAGALATLGNEDEALNVLSRYLASTGSFDSYRVAQTRSFWRLRQRPDYQQLVKM
jgi:DNA-binding SARP family transcriptional activator/TolB-like protein